MTHTCTFRAHVVCDLVPCSKSLDERLTEIVLTYDSVEVQLTHDLERVAHHLISLLSVQKLMGRGDDVLECVNISVFTSSLYSVGEGYLADWVSLHSKLSIHDISTDAATPSLWIILQ